MADQEQFTLKNKLIIYIGAFVEFYNLRNHGQVYKIYGIKKLKKICASTVENPRKLSID